MNRGFGLALVSAAVLTGAVIVHKPAATLVPEERRAPTATPTNPVPDYVMTPGAAVLTPSAGGQNANPSGGYGGNLFGLPPSTATPVGMPAYTTSPGGTPPGRPRGTGDCGDGRWRTYGLGFTSQQNCEDWTRTHPAGATEMGTAGGATPSTTAGPTTPTPTPRSTPRARRGRPTPEETPGLSMRPAATPLPILRARYRAAPVPPSADAASVRSATSAS